MFFQICGSDRVVPMIKPTSGEVKRIAEVVFGEAEGDKEVVSLEVVSSRKTMFNMLKQCNLRRIVPNLYHCPNCSSNLARSLAGTTEQHQGQA